MRKMLLSPLIVCMVALLSTLWMPAVHAKKPITLKSELFIELSWGFVGFSGLEGYPWGMPVTDYTWFGTVWGDINGEFYVTLVEASFPGKTEHFSETWLIETDGGVTEGFDEGVWSFNNFKWVANGGVTSATETWSYLVGYDMHYSGTTTEFPVPPTTPVSGTGTLILSSN